MFTAALTSVAAQVSAQEPTDGGAPTSPPLDTAERVPPRALVVPAIVLPADSEADAYVEALLTIGRDGVAQLYQCNASRTICDAIRAALIEAEFEPARVAGEPVHARVNARFHVQRSQSEAAQATDVELTPARDEETPEYGAIARIQRPAPNVHALELAEMREVPGAFGDPFRVIEALPGVTPVISGLPYVYVRGAPPAATAYLYDDIQLPALFHLALGPAVVHPAMIGPIDFYTGVAPARYGRKTGGVVSGQAAYRPLRSGVHGELELRLIDMQGYVARPIGKRGRIEVGARYGYPGLLTKLFEPRSVVQYWDYQLRSVIPVSAATELSLVVLGSYDMIGRRENGRINRDIELQFHRLELRSVTRKGKLTVGYALAGGFERSGLDEDFEVTAARVGPKFWVENHFGALRLRVGADMLATVGKIDDPLGETRTEVTPVPPPYPGMSISGQVVTMPVSETTRSSHITNPIYRAAAGRNVVGSYIELSLPFARTWDVSAGLRGDLWLTAGDVQKALEPRLVLSHRPHPQVTWHGAVGLAYQPAVFLIPLPGVADVALDRGLQRAIQSELGSVVELPASLSIDTKVYAHFYRDMLSFDAIDSDEDVDCSIEDMTCSENEGFARMHAYSYGAELLLRRSYKERISGWLAYTLSKADARSDGGRSLTPSFDVRHVGNLVFQWRITDKWHAAVRGYGQSGRFPFAASGELDPRQRKRMPSYYRGDLQVSRMWKKRWGELRLTFDWLNFTMQREAINWDCSDTVLQRDECKIQYLDYPLTIPMLGVRGSW